jgi:hypothetical protein
MAGSRLMRASDIVLEGALLAEERRLMVGVARRDVKA